MTDYAEMLAHHAGRPDQFKPYAAFVCDGIEMLCDDCGLPIRDKDEIIVIGYDKAENEIIVHDECAQQRLIDMREES